MILFKDENVKDEFSDNRLCHYLHWKVVRIAQYAEDELGINIIITSVWRNDSEAHKEWRAVDVRVSNPEHGTIVIDRKASALLDRFHDSHLRRYGNYDSFLRHDVDRGDHIHIQRPAGEFEFKAN